MALLEVKNIDKNFGKKKAMTNVSFNVEAGHIVGLIGPNGAGKSTTMRAITGLMSYSNGTILFDDKPITFSDHQALDKVGNLIEYPAIYPNMTALEHLNLYAMDTQDSADFKDLMHKTQIDGDNFGKRKAKNFSLGMKQRLGIAIALIRNPKLVILDEPMNGLDPQSVHDLRELIRDLADQGVAFLISSHLLDELQKLVDDVVIINHGKIIETATMTEFFSHDKVRWVMDTSDNDATVQLAQDNKWTVTVDEGHVQISGADNLQNVITAMNHADIQIQTLNTVTGNLEKSLLDMLANDDKGE
ncbi:ABC-type multidrug transport system, ATPase component [Leuconostoc gelidum subsp. gasicomitatum]|uniref:ABC-type multidrug transport system, ATPase component n=1 Tax=Leuconostoc gasicomitatum TaxID=115778 RepID=A0A9Q3SXB7_9LACO|nr:ATP-binding cassette domain-containing protein [Leuconostoc gasicomitatum]MBZ5953245.1 ATP-binding cassette domain-containing protein [Leuconostoc gasicomitatum]MBZ5962695.1 ATP-binding cassette domain-containing protein [Leuconostoc gasicomitatum]MBZ5969386.1 ATP-binding cassette domain-containing protein [Leuconostoc gasicomitatum]MBZ5985346.1 ATP-binding cassette domain-containing protein [Leuconostoc gasicomitatum]MBZ5988257.1 ATP-binding cassette domain-containing protein [Leuconostoc 